MMNLLTHAIVRLIDTERFYAEIVLGMDIKLSKRISTAGVYIKDKVYMEVNAEFFSKLSLNEQVAVLKHECHHILLDHIPRSKELAPDVYSKNKDEIDRLINKQKHQVINVSADCAINPNIPNIPGMAVLPKQFNLEDGQTLEWYFTHLKNNKDLEGLGDCLDGHSLWAESDTDKEILREKIRQLINDAAKRARGAGAMTNNDELMVSRLNYKAKDWKADLKRFVARQIETTLDSSRKKRNRRYGVAYPGVIKKEDKLNIGVAIDTSGSVSDEALGQFMAEIAVISKYANIVVVEADAEIKNRYVFDPKKKDYKVSGRGGTAYQPALDHFSLKESVDGLIYFGDMDCYDSEQITKPKYPVLWAIIGDQNPPVEWGSRTTITVKVHSN